MHCDLKILEALIRFSKRRPKNIPCYKIKYLTKFRVKCMWESVLSLGQPSHLTDEEPDPKVPYLVTELGPMCWSLISFSGLPFSAKQL